MNASTWSRVDPATDWSSLEQFNLQSTGLARLWRGFMTARCFVAAMLWVLQAIAYALKQPTQLEAMAVSIGYLLATLVATRYTRYGATLRHFGPAWMATIGVDLVTFAALQVLQSGTINFTPLFALPVLMGAVLGTGRIGLGTTAIATLLLLAQAGWSAVEQPHEASARFVQAALTGTGLFVVALLAHELAGRLAREEALALRNRSTARMHAEVNDLVIETLNEGVLVVDTNGRVHAGNPAASEMLGRPQDDAVLPVDLASHSGWAPLAALARQTFALRAPQSIEIPLAQPSGPSREVHVRTQLTHSGGGQADSLCVMFLQDLRELEARIRTEKLAAMGRMSAAVAHEIRNPLAAIAQASALLGEDLVDPVQRQLIGMVQQNAQRLARIVDDVLDVARARQQRTIESEDRLALDATVRVLSEEWVRQAQRQGVMLVLEAGSRQVPFDSEHLRRILVNLLDNAARYAGEREGSIQVSTRLDPVSAVATLCVWSDGAALEPAVQHHLFEPFFSSESRSSGLGLYLCRELSERHGATIDYARRALFAGGPEGNEFRIDFAPL